MPTTPRRFALPLTSRQLCSLLDGVGEELATRDLDQFIDHARELVGTPTLDSWLGHGSNRGLTRNQLTLLLTPDWLDRVSLDAGTSRRQAVRELCRALPRVVDKLSRGGRLLPAAEREQLLADLPGALGFRPTTRTARRGSVDHRINGTG